MLQKIPASRTAIFMPEDVSVMREAFLRISTERTPADRRGNGEVLGKAIIRLYNMGLVEPTKLAAVAAMLASSNGVSGSEPPERL